MESSTLVHVQSQILCLLSLHLHDTPSAAYDLTNSSKTSPSTTHSRTYTPPRPTHTPSSYNAITTSYHNSLQQHAHPPSPGQTSHNTSSPHSLLTVHAVVSRNTLPPLSKPNYTITCSHTTLSTSTSYRASSPPRHHTH